MIGLFMGLAAEPPRIANEVVSVQAVKDGADYAGFDVRKGGSVVARVRFGGGRILVAKQCTADAEARELHFGRLAAKAGSGLALARRDEVTVSLAPHDPYPAIRFDLHIEKFDAGAWDKTIGKEPFQFLSLHMRTAQAWHHRGWLNATPLVDPFPLLIDPHVGSPEISAYHYNRTWSYTPPLGAHPIPVIGLWDPSRGRYAAFEFQIERMRTNSERDIATGYHWVGKTPYTPNAPLRGPQEAADQYVALVYPHGGAGYQQLALPGAGDHIASACRLIWSDALPAAGDPNRFFYTYLQPRVRSLPRVPEVVDLSWLPGHMRLSDFGGPASGSLIGGVEGNFQVAGSKLIGGWGWHNEGPTAAAKRAGDAEALARLDEEARNLLAYAKRFRVDGDECVYWEKPLTGQWTPEWGGPEATSLHNANGFAAGRLFLGLYRDAGKTEYLPIVDGVYNWAKHVAWTRNEFADVPSSPFAIGGTLSASFCLDYYMTFRNSPDEARRAEARKALDLARSFTYRYLVMWISDNNRFDNLDSTFLWEPNSGRDWTGAACSNEVFWNLDTLAQTAVHTGDPILMWALQGSLSRWHLLYQDRYKESLADYGPSDMTEGYGLYKDNVYGVGKRAQYGFGTPLYMLEPVGGTQVRVLAGERAAMAFDKNGAHTRIKDYRYTDPGNLEFTVVTTLPTVHLSLTVPYVDMTDRKVVVVRGAERIEPEVRRTKDVLWSLIIQGLRDGDKVVVGEPNEASPPLPTEPPYLSDVAPATLAGDARVVSFRGDVEPSRDWADVNSWAGAPEGRIWAYGVPFGTPAAGSAGVATKPFRFETPVRAAAAIAVLYGAGKGNPPRVLMEDGSSVPVDTSLESVAWRAWPPIFGNRLVMALASTEGKTAVGIDPAGREVWAVTALLDMPRASDGASARLQDIVARLKAGAIEWAQTRRDEQRAVELGTEMADIPEGSIALLPPSASGPVINLISRARLLGKTVTLSPEQLVDPEVFNARRFPVAVCADGEDYVHTVRQSGDGAQALEHYLREGGTLVLAANQPLPLCYATGPGFHRADPLAGRLGLPIGNAIETAVTPPPGVEMEAGQEALRGVPPRFAYPPGDPRLRTVMRGSLPAGAKYTPIYAVRGVDGKEYGDAAALLENALGAGRILYVWDGLQRSTEAGPAITEALVRFIMEAARKR